MAKSKNVLGNDPLAWLTTNDQPAARVIDSTEPHQEEPEQTVETKLAPKTSIELVEESFTPIAARGEYLVADFYTELFQQQPQLKKLFEGVSEQGQQKKFLAALVLLVQNLRHPALLDSYLTELGKRHINYGVKEADYYVVKRCLLNVLEKYAESMWSEPVATAWNETLDNVITKMTTGASPVEEREMADLKNNNAVDIQNELNAINRVMGVITFEPSGIIIDVNDNFLQVVGYAYDEVVGKHHRMFVSPQDSQSQAYADFWAKLNRGEFDSGEYKRVGKSGREIWLQASYNPIFDDSGKVIKVIKYATDITTSKLEKADSEGQLNAIDKSMGVISFDMDGTIIDVNDNFLSVVGYSKDEVIGKHHRIFVPPQMAQSAAYNEFWAKLNRGEFDSDQYQRISKSGDDVWLQASYNPILDLNGKPYKVVKYAADITKQKQLQFEVENATITISTAASEISEGTLDLSQRTEEQASSLQETAASMEELTSTVKQNSDNARQANQLALGAREKAEKGGTVIQEAIVAMSAISASSKKVADIIGVIDEIAFQTNLLALNAAVEAARAGEQGRGFAVVASEVRNLAQRSAAAAKEIKELINDSGEKVREGSTLVNESGRTLEEIVEGAKKVGDIISEIAAAGAEQASGIEQVNQAVTQMDEMTQQNAALVEQTAAASQSLDEQVKSLEQMMAFFKTGVEVTQTVAPKPSHREEAPKQAPARRPVAKAKSTEPSQSANVPKTTANYGASEEWEEF